jgi:hypothetical protein
MKKGRLKQRAEEMEQQRKREQKGRLRMYEKLRKELLRK